MLGLVAGACGGAQQSPPPSSRAETLPSATASTTTTAVPTVSVSASATPSASSTSRSPELVVAAMRSELRRCYNRAVKADPNLRAAIRLTIDVAPDGSVTKVTPHATPPVPGELELCLVSAASKVAFDPPGGNGATFELPINLVPASP